MITYTLYVRAMVKHSVNSLQVHPSSGAAVCRCQSGWDHAPGGNTIEGCPVRVSAKPASSSSVSSESRVLHNRLASNSVGCGSNCFSAGSGVDVAIRQQSQGDPCRPSPCGQGADCTVSGSRAVS